MKNLNLGAFKAYDIRTRITSLDAELQNRLCNAVGLYIKDSLKSKSVVICRDARLYVPQLAENLSEVLRHAGIDIYINPQPISTCQFYYTLMQHRDSAGIMLTASHNPGEYVGMKILGPGLEPIAFGYGKDGGISRIKENYEKNLVPEEGAKRGRVTVINELDSFIDYSMRLSGVAPGALKGCRILIETLSGSAGNEVALAFQKAGAELELRNVVPNGFFPQGDPNPIIESSIAPSREAMRKGNYDFGFCFDGDGDRLDMMASDGRQIVPGYNMAILIPEICKIFKGYFGSRPLHFYSDVKSIPDAVVEMAKQGVSMHVIRNGHSFIKAKLNENFHSGYLAAEEESAHYYMNFPYDIDDISKGTAAVENTLFFALLSARCYMQDPDSYKKAIEREQNLFRFREWPLHCEEHPEIMQELMDRVEKVMKAQGARIIRTMDDGSDLDAVLMRFNLPEIFDKNSNLEDDWVQVAERISRSEDAMVRWEVASNSEKLCHNMNNLIREITDSYVRNGLARY